MRFFTGLHHPADARHFDAAFVSVNAIRKRKSDFPVGGDWILDSGAFSEISRFGHYRSSVAEYAAQIRRWKTNGNLLAAVAQDYMCEPFIVAKTGLSVAEHQRLTIERYDALHAELRRLFKGPIPFHLMPVLQGRSEADYLRHIAMYGARLTPGMWVGVGSVCKRQGNPAVVESILRAIKRTRPDLWLHGFGVKLTALMFAAIRRLLATADSMAWSFAARMAGRSANDWREALRFRRRVHAPSREPEQLRLDLAA